MRPTGSTTPCPRCGAPGRGEPYCEECGEPLLAVAPERRRGARAVRVLMVAAALAGGVGAGTVYLIVSGGEETPAAVQERREDDEARPSAPTSLSALPDTPDPLPARLEVIAPDQITVTASSTLPSEIRDSDGARLTYGARNLLDDDPTTSWAHDGRNDARRGVGQVLRFVFDRPYDLSHIEIENGYGENARLYGRNGRIRTAVIETDHGRRRTQLVDERDAQQLTSVPGITTTVTIRIEQVYPGSAYRDLAVTAIRFWGRAA